MEHKRRVAEELLLDFHLDRLTDEDCSWIEAELRRDGELRGSLESNLPLREDRHPHQHKTHEHHRERCDGTH